MAFRDGLSRFPSISNIVFIILFLVLIPLVHSSRSCLQYHEPTLAAAGNIKVRDTAQDIHQSYPVKKMGKGAAASGLVTDEESERQVPTGPDPLHHNNNPTTRP